MLDLAESGTPLEVPAWIHLVLWPALIVWAAALRSARRGHRLLGSAGLGFALAALCLGVDGATLAAAVAWPTPAADPFVFGLLWIAALFSVSAYLILRAPDGGDDGGSEGDPPEPPWWPEFERQFRDYTRAGPRTPARSPRAPPARPGAPSTRH
jgi:hypothetical protein